MKDWLDQEVSVGDKIIYAAMSGRSVTMVIAEVLEFRDNGSIKVQPLKSSRWKQHGRTRYIDARTGKGIDAYADKHYEKLAHWRHKETGEEISCEEYDQLRQDFYRGLKSRGVFDSYEYVRGTHKDYVKMVESVSPVTLSVTKNVTKWTG